MMDDRIKVAIRVRPLNERELNGSQTNAWTVQNDSIFQTQSSDLNKPSSSAVYTFDKIFCGDISTNDVHEKLAREIILSTMNGVNGTIFAYGQTSSGKTHTMQGNPKELGIITLALQDIFHFIMQTPDREFLLRVSYLEIYNENIRDLLNTDNDNLKIHENNNREIFLGNLTESIVVSPEEVAQLMQRGESNRHVGETNMNERSSRSHTIFRMVIESRERKTVKKTSYPESVKVSCLNLVDLAGSERVSHTGAEGIRLREGGHINKSLLTLGTVIAKLSDAGSDRGHVPYRDSKLTRILQPSLGGNARTAIICTITPASGHCEETTSTLKFASRAKNIQNKPEVNEVLSDEALLKKYRKEIADLKKQLDEVKNRPASKPSSDQEDQNSQTRLRSHYDELKAMILTSSHISVPKSDKNSRKTRRQTWFPGVHSTLDQVSGDESSDKDGSKIGSFLDEFKTEALSKNSKKRSVVSPDSSVKKVKLEELEQKVEQVVHSRTAILEGIQKLLEDDGVATTEGVPDELQDLRLRLVEWRDRLRETRYALQENERKYAEEQELSHTEVNSFRDLYEAAKTKAENLSKEMEALDAIHKARLNSEAEAVQKARDELATMEQTMREVREAKELEMQSFAECLQESEQQRMLLETEKAEQLRLLEGEAGQLRRQLDEFKMVKRDLQAAMMALDARNTALGNLTNELRDVKNEMQSLREDTGIQIRERDEQIESFRVLLEEREAKIKGLQQDMAIAHSCVEQLDEKLDISKQLEYSLNVEMQRLQDELAEADQVKQILENLKQVLNDREAENARLLSQLTEAQHRIKSLVDELSTKESLLRSLSAERDELKDHTVPELKGKLADAESMAVDLQSKYVDSEARWQSLSQEAGGLNIQLAELQAVRGNLEEAMRTMNKEHGELSAKLSHTQNQLKLLSDDSNNRDHKIGDLSEKILYLQDELRTKETTITTLEQSIRAANALVDDTKRIANERMEEIEAVIEAKIMEVETAEQDVQTLQTKYHDSEAELERMRRQLVENEDEIYVFQRQIEQQQSLLMEKELGYAEQIEAMKGEHGRHVQELEVVTEDLRKKLSDAGEQTKSLLQEVSELQEKIVIFERSRNELHNTVTALEQTAFEANVLARSTRDDANRRIEELDMAMKDKDTALSAVEDKNILLEKQYLEVSSEIQRLYRQLADTECELQALREAGQRNDASRTEQETTYLEQLASLRAEHARMIQEKDQAIFDLTKKLDVFDEQVQALVEEAEDLHHQLEDYQKTKQEYTVMVNELEEVHKGIQSLEAVTRTVEEEKTAMEIMFNQRIQELQIEKNNVIEVLKRDHQNIIEDWHRRIEDVQGQLTEANKELEVKISQQQEIGARFERGEYIDIGELEKLKAGMQTKWDDEKITLKDEIESGRKALETMASRLDGMKQELVAAVRYGQDFDSKIEAGDYIRREDVSTLKTSWLEEQSELQTKIQNLDGELKATHTFLEETKKEVQVKDNQLLEIALHFQNGKFVDVEKLKKLEADLNERWEVERTELENALEVCKQDLKMTEGHLKSVQEKFEVMIKKEKDMAVKIEQGHYIDAVKVMQIQAEFESKWESERNILEVKLEKEAGELVSTKTMLEHAQTQIMLLKGREEEVASRIVSGDLIEKAKFEYLKAEMVMDWEREKAVNESLTEKLCIIQTSMEESKNEMELKERQMQEITTRLQKSNELTIQELTRVNTEAKKNWESQRAELEKIISQSESKYKVQHAEFEAAKRELQQKSLAIEKLSVECEKQKALFSKEQKTSLQRIQELESRSDDISRSSVDSNRKITQLRQQLHQRESEVQELLKRIEQHENKVSKDNHDNLIELQTAEKAETKSKELMMLTSLQAEVAKLTVEKENLGKQINTQRMIAENEITKYKHLEATHEKLIADSFKLKKENERLLEETTSKTDRRIPEEAATLQSKRKHERTRDKEKDNGADDRLVTKDDRENAGHTNMVCNKTGKSLDVKTVDVTETRLPLIDVNAPKSSARRQRMLNRQIKTDENGNKGKESAECNQQ